MIPCLLYKEKVVSSSITVILLFFISHFGWAQGGSGGPAIDKITFSADGVYLHEVIQQLGKITGLHFIYSSDKIQVNTLITFNVHNRSLDDVFSMLERLANVSFRRRDGYVIIKTAVTSSPSSNTRALQGSTKKPEDTVFTDPDQTLTVVSTDTATYTIPPRQIAVYSPALRKGYLEKNLMKLQPYFDTTMLQRLSLNVVRKLNVKTRHRGWFVSAGVSLNDHSMGAELQGGIRSLYFVFNPGVLSTGKFRNAYGVGSSFLLSQNLSLNPVYAYSVVHQKQSFIRATPQNIVERQVQLSSRHHQLKLMLQYALNENLNMRIGTSFNYLQTKRYTEGQITRAVPTRILIRAMSEGPARTDQINAITYFPARESFLPATNVVYDSQRNDHRTVRSWFSWELGVSYRVNFFKRQ